MFDVIIDRNKRYKADDFFQWDTHVLFNIYGLSLGRAPEIHFAKSGMSEAIVKQSEMTRDGIISVQMPDVMLQSTAPVKVYICGYEGEEFRTWYALELKVNGRLKPADYIAEDDEKIYSYNALEWKVDNTVVELTRANEDLHNRIINETNELNIKAYEKVKDNLDYAIGLTLDTPSQTIYFNEDGSVHVVYADGSTEHITINENGVVTERFDYGTHGTRIETTVFNEDGSISITFEEVD